MNIIAIESQAVRLCGVIKTKYTALTCAMSILDTEQAYHWGSIAVAKQIEHRVAVFRMIYELPS